MSNFRTRILGLGVFALAFAGLSYGQSVTCVTGPQTNPTLRAEGQTELLARMDTTCTNAGPGVGNGLSTGGTVYIQTSLPITSKTWTTAGVVNNEATLVAWGAPVGTGLCTTTFALAPAGCVFQGTVSGNQVSFQLPGPVGAALGVIPTAGNAVNFSVVNIRVNASNGGAPQVTESGILSYTINSVPPTSSNTAIGASVQGAGFILKTLGAATITGFPAALNTCTTYGTATTAAPTMVTLNISELVSGAFLTQVGEQGQYVSGSNTGTAQSGDQILITLANVPSSATIWVPQTLTVAGTTLTVANSTAPTSGPYSLAATTLLANAPFVSFTPSSNTVVIPYTVTASVVAGPTNFPVDVRMAIPANTATAQGPVTISVAYGPAAAALSGPATSVPTFLAGTPVTVNGSSVTICQTSLLYPFVTNQLGFDTGIVIANTSTDNLSVAGGSIASKQAGTCNLSFYGSGAPTPATGVADPGGSTASGTTHAFLLSAVAPGFQGYMIATCPFQFAHGFGFLAYNLTQNNGAVEGYIAEVMTRANIFAAASTAPDPVTF